MSICVYLWLILCVFASINVSAQVAPVYDRGVMGLAQVLKRLNTSASAMMIGAHPDDEDTALLAYLARGENARTAYLSLTRGDGGQNIIGSELGEALGVIRTEELLQARRLDGTEQYFTRAYDYGFSKTLAEAQAKWPEPVVLCDAVRAIREFRPLVVISQFSGTPADGHGQHQYAGHLAPIAVKAAADATQCRDAGPTWNVKKFYVRHGFRATTEPRLRINTGRYDPILGRSYFEIAMEARSQHKSQEQGVLELKGEMFSGLNLVGSESSEKGIFDGLDTTIKGIAENAENREATFEQKLSELQTLAASVLSEYNVRSPNKLLPLLTKGYKLSEEAQLATRIPGSRAAMNRKRYDFLQAIKLAAGIQLNALSEKETVVAGEEFAIAVSTFYPANDSITIKEAAVKVPTGWIVNRTEAPASGPQTGFFRRENPNSINHFALLVPDNASLTEPYWLLEPRNGDIFSWKEDENRTMPFQRSVAVAIVALEIYGVEVKLEEPVEYRYADDTRGEIRRNLNVVPRLSLDVDKTLLIAPSSGKSSAQRVSVSVTNNLSRPAYASLSIYPLDKSFISVSPGKEVELKQKGEKTSVPFDITIPANAPPGRYRLRAQALIGGSFARTFLGSQQTITYPHIQTHRRYNEASADVLVLDVKTTTVRVGYVVGSGDRVPDAIRELGVAVETITPVELASGDLSKYDTIIVGIRAYQVRSDLVANNKRLLDFATAGGTLIVQYQLPGYTQQNLAPFPAQQGPRTSDENAAVNILVPDHPLMNFPNKLTATDFEGWVQERNLYNFSTMDAKYVGLLESHDAGEAENKGGLAVADVGKGKYVYCSYSLFRQLPAGVPGGYRLLANMISLPKAK